MILYQEGVTARLRKLTDGEGVSVVSDGVGEGGFETCLDCLRVPGYSVGYGNASGNFPVFAPLTLMRKGSLYVTRVAGRAFAFRREHRMNIANEVFSARHGRGHKTRNQHCLRPIGDPPGPESP